MEVRYTKHQVARTTRPDAERNGVLYLIKACSALRLTYQIYLMTYIAISQDRKLVIDVPKRCQLSSALRDWQKKHSQVIRVRKV